MIFDRKKQNLLENEFEHRLETQKAEYELKLEEMKMERVLLEVDSECRSVLLKGLCEEAAAGTDPALRKLAERISLFSALQFEESSAQDRPFRVLEILDAVVAERRPEADARGIKLRCAVKSIRDTAVLLKSEWVREILRILVSDALRSAEAGDSVMLTAEQLETAEKDSAAYRFTVRDTARDRMVGAREKYFKPFGEMRHGRDTAGRVDMAIAERLTQLLGIDLSVSPAETEGTEISFTVSGKKA